MTNKKNPRLRAATFSKGIYKRAYLRELLGVEDLTLRPKPWDWSNVDLVVGWGRKPNTVKASRYSKLRRLPFYTLEDGFLSSIGLGRQGNVSLSLVVDPKGIYYDARNPSTLEDLLNGDDSPFTSDVMRTAQAAQSVILEHNLTKYNGAPFATPEMFPSDQAKVLVVDQVAGDLSLTYGVPQGFDFEKIISAARTENPDARIYVKLHPETIAGFRSGLFSDFSNDPSIEFITQDLNPLSILKLMDKVYVATSLMGFEALMLGKSVVCFGMPFYAGWGPTEDRVHCNRRKKQRSTLEIFAAAYVLYSRYVNPQTGRRCDILQAIDFLRRELYYDTLNRGEIFCFGIRHWKRCNVLPYLGSSRNRIVFVKTAEEAKQAGIKPGSQVVIWGAREPKGLGKLLRISGKPPLRMEDGFLRSVGLGSDLVRPSSLVLDAEGIYFNPTKPSALETLLSTTQFTPKLLEQATRVRRRIVHARLTKYNSEPHLNLDVGKADGRRLILVPGQVEDDASVAMGCRDIRTNLELLEAVRTSNPQAYIIFKPHPDVVNGNRIGTVDSAAAKALCDQVLESVNIAVCLEVVDEVHTMTSLVGFDALLRERSVVVYGRPFYAGWGLTDDRLSIPRRTRTLTLDELVAGALLLYPRYYDWEAGCWTDCEGAIDSLISARQMAEASIGLGRLNASYIERQMRKLGLLIKGLAHAW